MKEGMDIAKFLKPCPFCGGQAEIERRGTTRQSTIYACLECGCRLETGETFNLGVDWNERVDPIMADHKQPVSRRCAEIRAANHPLTKAAWRRAVDAIKAAVRGGKQS